MKLMSKFRKKLFGLLACALLSMVCGQLSATQVYSVLSKIECGNFVYAGDKSSVCFADRFLSNVQKETNLEVTPKYFDVKLREAKLFHYPFSVFSGEDDFKLQDAERQNLRKYLLNGGFVLASPSCSNEKWDKAFRREMKLTFPNHQLERLPMEDPIFNTVYDIKKLVDKKGKTVLLEAMRINGRIAMIYSKEGLNDVANAKGCCCCGGNEIREPEKVNVNILVYALLY